ncbi:solute carrier family 22 member 1 [Biomphalaria glabrata]|nr:solute carrier family 22 member 1 [Biomphalaria glabrata]
MEQDESRFDDVFRSLKWNGFYQMSRCLVLLLSSVILAFNQLSIIFIGNVPGYHCRELQNLNVTVNNVTVDVLSVTNHSSYNVTYNQCSIEVKNATDIILSADCKGYDYDDDVSKSFVSEWDLVCEKEIMSDNVQVFYMLGEIVASLFLSQLSDNYGRKPTLVWCGVLSLITSGICSFPPNLVFLIAFKFLTGVFLTTSTNSAYTLLTEMMPTDFRAVPETIKAFFYLTAMLITCLIAFLIKDWHWVQMTLALLSTYVLVLHWFSDESIIWLCTTKKYTQAEVTIRKIARINQVDPREALQAMRKSADEENSESQHLIAGNTTNWLDFVRNKNLLKLLLISSLLRYVATVGNHGLVFTSASLTENFYLGYSLGTLVEYPATLLFYLVVNRLGRKKCVYIFHYIAGTVLVVSSLLLMPFADNFPEQFWLSFVLSLCGRWSISICYPAVALYTMELFPTCFRNTGTGTSEFASSVGSLVSPYFRTLIRHVPWAPNIILGTMCVLSPLTIRGLPETKGRELPHTLEDMNRMMNKPQEEIKENGTHA